MSGRNPSSGVSAIVLAAGMSRRMGTPKQLLQIGGKPLLQVSLENVRASGVDEIILVLGFAADRITKEIPLPGIKVVRNEEFEQGMGTSLRAGLAAVDPKARAALIVLADQPLVRATTLDRLIDFHSESGGQIIIPTYRGFRGNPVLLDRSVFPELRELSGDVGCRAIFGSHTENIRKLPVDDIGILQDLDSVDDYQKLKSRGEEAGKGGQGAADGSMLEGIKEVPDGQPQLVLVGHDEVVQALAQLGRLLGFGTTVVDPLLSLADIPATDRILRILDFS
ncbi:MAG TPA: NTP transferase domain-containing protein, partial [Candidatus Angelobacter sp.]|nr:NTP transferase domain-containing protein [Candidatus Angelobacter sp.]